MPPKYVWNENLNTQNTNNKKSAIEPSLLCMQYFFTAVFISAAQDSGKENEIEKKVNH